MDEFSLEAWTVKRTFRYTLICQFIIDGLQQVEGASTDEAVAKYLSRISKRDYMDVDVRLIMGAASNVQEREALEQMSQYLAAINRTDINGSVEAGVAKGLNPLWLGFVAEYYRDMNRYYAECEALLASYKRMLDSLPDLPEGADLTEVVGWFSNPDQPEAVTEFIDQIQKHFEMVPGAFIVPSASVWPLSKYIVVRTLDTPDGTVVTIVTHKGMLSLNAVPN